MAAVGLIFTVMLAAWCPTTTTGSERPRCPCDPTSTSTTSTTGPELIIEPPHLVPPTPPTTAVIVDAVTVTRPEPRRRLPVTGPDGETLVVGGLFLLLGGLLIAARPGRAS